MSIKNKKLFLKLFLGIPSILLTIFLIEKNPDKDPREMYLLGFFLNLIYFFSLFIALKILKINLDE